MKILFVDVNTICGGSMIPAASSWTQDAIAVKVREAIAHFYKNGWTCIATATHADADEPPQAIFGSMMSILDATPGIAYILCTDLAGEYCWQISSTDIVEVSDREVDLIGQFCKPDTGMLQLAKLYEEDAGCQTENILIVGDNGDDLECASAMKSRFVWFFDWINRFQELAL